MLLPIFLISFAIFADAKVASSALRNEQRTTCMTDECKEFARAVITNMNTKVNPCVDFYEYTCGNWAKKNPIPPGKPSWAVLAAAAQENKRKIEDLLKSPSQTDEIPPVKIVKQWYKVCTDKDRIEKRGMRPLINVMSKLGGWPIIMAPNEWNETAHKWQLIDDYYAVAKGTNMLHEIRVAVYGRNSMELSAVLDVPALPPATWLLSAELDEEANETSEEKSDDEIMNSTMKFNKDGKYWKFISTIVKEVAKARGVNIPIKRLEEDIEEILNFQWKLGKITNLMDDHNDMTIKNFQNWYNHLAPHTEKSKVNWARKIIDIFKNAKVDLDFNTNLKVVSPGYFERLPSLLQRTPSRTIVNYLHWNFVSSTISKTTEEMKKLYTKTTTYDDDDEQTTRSDECIEEAKMDDVIAYEYIRKFFSDKTLDKALEAIDNIEKEIAIQIKGSNWADETVKNGALRKLRTIKRNIAYPDWYNNATLMRHYLDGLTIGSGYFENSVILNRYYTRKALRALKYKNDVEPWDMHPLTINAFYMNKDNSITVTAANFQKPFFSDAQPNTINYALTGFLIAHEMNHPFDNERHALGKDDEEGSAIQWSEAMTVEYEKSVQCFMQQYDSYTLDGTPSGPKVKDYGNMTLDENMPDTMGLQAAFKAFKQNERINRKPAEALPGLESFSSSQLFFISFGNLWCESIKPDRLVTTAKLQAHSLGRLRLTGSVSNNEDFAKTFNCPLGSPMNPVKKCSIWKHYDGQRQWQRDLYEARRV